MECIFNTGLRATTLRTSICYLYRLGVHVTSLSAKLINYLHVYCVSQVGKIKKVSEIKRHQNLQILLTFIVVQAPAAGPRSTMFSRS